MPGLLHLPLLVARMHHWSFSPTFGTQPVLALVAGILILIRPKLLNFVVAAYLIVLGLVGIFNLHW